MLYCLSSGSRKRYLDDIVRCLAMPEGSTVTFRYDKRYISPELLSQIKSEQGTERDAVLLFVDQADSAYEPFFVPCRSATLLEVKDHGEIVVLILVLKGLAYTDEITAYQSKLRGDGSDAFPKWESGQLVGTWFLQSEAVAHKVASFDAPVPWHTVVKQLDQRRDFSSVRVFPKILGIAKVGRDEGQLKLESNSLWYKLAARSEYILEIYHYHPQTDATDTEIKVHISDENALRPISPLDAVIDSRYDEKRFRFETANFLASSAPVTLVLELRDRAKDQATLQFDIPVRVSADTWLIAAKVIVAGIFVSVPGLTAAYVAGKLSLGVIVIAVGAGLLAAAASILRLPKSI